MNKNYFNTLFLGLPKAEKLPVTFAILTACNPMDRPLSKDENKKRNLEMFQILSDKGKSIHPDYGKFTRQGPSRAKLSCPLLSEGRVGIGTDLRATSHFLGTRRSTRNHRVFNRKGPWSRIL